MNNRSEIIFFSPFLREQVLFSDGIFVCFLLSNVKWLLSYCEIHVVLSFVRNCIWNKSLKQNLLKGMNKATSTTFESELKWSGVDLFYFCIYLFQILVI